jgi:hypothetical protein
VSADRKSGICATCGAPKFELMLSTGLRQALHTCVSPLLSKRVNAHPYIFHMDEYRFPLPAWLKPSKTEEIMLKSNKHTRLAHEVTFSTCTRRETTASVV